MTILLDGENVSDSRSVASFGDDATTPMEDDLGLDEFQPDMNYDQAEIIFAQGDTLPLSDPLNETAFDVSITYFTELSLKCLT